MAGLWLGPIEWGLSRSEEGAREYKLRSRVRTGLNEGPYTALNAAGTPAIGSAWSFGGDNDPWAFCLPSATVKQQVVEEPNRFWVLEQTFSTFTQGVHRCQDQSVENPLAEPPRLSGSFCRYGKEVQRDRHNRLILSSSFEPIAGIERDANRPNVRIELNYPSLGLDTFSEMMNGVNDAPLWGVPARCLKLSGVDWTRNVYGSCSYYYTIQFEFEIKWDGFDRSDIANTGKKVLAGQWNRTVTPPTWEVYSWADINDPTHYETATDINNQPLGIVLLDLFGNQIVRSEDAVFIPTVELDDEFNFLLLGIPSSL